MNGNYICFVKIWHAQVPDSSYHELSSFFCYSELFIIRDESWYHLTDPLNARVLDSSYWNSKSCQIDVLDLIQFIDKGFALVLAQYYCILNLVGLGIRSHCVQESQIPVHLGSLDFHQEVPNLVPKAVGIVCWAHSAFEDFDNLDQNLAQFVELRVFYSCGQFLVPWPHGIEPKLAWPDNRRPWSSMVVGYQVNSGAQVFLWPRQAKCSLVARCMAWLQLHVKLRNLRVRMLIESCVPPSLFQTKCPGCKMLQSSNPAMQSLSQLRWRCCLYKNKKMQ
jgi:hypothetical protein